MLARAMLVGLCLGVSPCAPAQGDDLDSALERAREGDRLLVLVLTSGSLGEESWIRSELRRPEWTEVSRPHQQLILRAGSNPSAASRFAVMDFPQVILVDSEGRDSGRIKGIKPALELGAKLRRMVEAAERFKAAEAVLRETPDDVEALFWIGSYRWNRGETHLAVESFRKVIDLTAGRKPEAPAAGRPFVCEALLRVAEHCLDCGKYPEAEGYFRRAVHGEDRETGTAAVLGLAFSLRRQSRTQEAIRVLEAEASQETSPRLDQTLFTLGYLHHESGEEETASRHFRAVVERYPETVYGERARRYLRQEDLGRQRASPEDARPAPASASALLMSFDG